MRSHCLYVRFIGEIVKIRKIRSIVRILTLIFHIRLILFDFSHWVISRNVYRSISNLK